MKCEAYLRDTETPKAAAELNITNEQGHTIYVLPITYGRAAHWITLLSHALARTQQIKIPSDDD